MKTQRFYAKDMRQAIRDISRVLGPDAVIISNTKVSKGIEVLATAEYDEDVYMEEEDNIFKDQFSNPNDRYHHSNLYKFSSENKSDSKLETTLPTEEQSRSTLDLIADRKIGNTGQYESSQITNEIPAELNAENTASLIDIQSELSGLRNLVKDQLAGFAWGDTARRHPLRLKLYKHLMELGLSQNLCKEISDQVSDTLNIKEAWEQAIKILINNIPEDNENILENNHIVALVGPTGVGKTTTIAKMAARYALKHGRENVALITTDCFRIGAHEQLRTYARILDVPLYTVSNETELAETLALVKDKDLVLVDSAGMSKKDEKFEAQELMLNKLLSKRTKTILVLSAATQYQSQMEIIKLFRDRVNACILTKLDEAANLGDVISNVVENRIAVAFTSDGQRVPEDLQAIDSENMVDRCVSLMREMDSMEEVYEKLIWGRSVNANV